VIRIQIRHIILSPQNAAKKRAADLDLNRMFAEDAEQAYLLGMLTISQSRKELETAVHGSCLWF